MKTAAEYPDNICLHNPQYYAEEGSESSSSSFSSSKEINKKAKLSTEYSNIRVPPIVSCKRRRSQRTTSALHSRSRSRVDRNPGIAAENAFLMSSLQKILQSVSDISDPVLREKVLRNPEFVRIREELAKQRLLPSIEEEEECSEWSCSSATSHCSEGSMMSHNCHHHRGEEPSSSECYSSMGYCSSVDEEIMCWDRSCPSEEPAPSALSEVACCFLDDHMDLLDDGCSQASTSSSLHSQNWLPQLTRLDGAIW
mmetsp:Transcript_4697/g.7006  ORF Transcript_4697/g.7006 Transcript_4697/m.7006 type:complete len:254 (-) Transcript_4697:189-950(-)